MPGDAPKWWWFQGFQSLRRFTRDASRVEPLDLQPLTQSSRRGQRAMVTILGSLHMVDLLIMRHFDVTLMYFTLGVRCIGGRLASLGDASCITRYTIRDAFVSWHWPRGVSLALDTLGADGIFVVLGCPSLRLPSACKHHHINPDAVYTRQVSRNRDSPPLPGTVRRGWGKSCPPRVTHTMLKGWAASCRSIN